MTERIAWYLRRLRNYRVPVVSARGYRTLDLCFLATVRRSSDSSARRPPRQRRRLACRIRCRLQLPADRSGEKSRQRHRCTPQRQGVHRASPRLVEHLGRTGFAQAPPTRLDPGERLASFGAEPSTNHSSSPPCTETGTNDSSGALLLGDRHRHFHPQTRSTAPERAHRIYDGVAILHKRCGPVDGRNQVLAKLHLQTVRSQCQQRLNPRARFVQCPLHLTAELLCLPLHLAAVRPTAATFSPYRILGEVRVHELRSFTSTFSLRFTKLPFARTRAEPAGARMRMRLQSNELKDGANPADRLD